MTEKSESLGVDQEGSTARAEAPASDLLSHEKQAELAAGFVMGDTLESLMQQFGVSEEYALECVWYWRDSVAPELELLRLRAEEKRISRPLSPIERMIDEATGHKQHPEATCQRCGRPNVWSWHAPSPLWNAVMRNRETGEDRHSIVCPPCFAELAVAIIGPHSIWCFKPHDLDVRPLWTDGDGREWDSSECLWK